ncbi:dihydrofolate reductase family protein [Myxococcus xanthus]|uniref:dihydrofolate reductase family protein n=1 Tax=Myxococcus xanthus TaxID=34 RepID=UPI001F3B1881|nr:hypothetical protein [Myxococcus xanthus]
MSSTILPLNLCQKAFLLAWESIGVGDTPGETKTLAQTPQTKLTTFLALSDVQNIAGTNASSDHDKNSEDNSINNNLLGMTDKLTTQQTLVEFLRSLSATGPKTLIFSGHCLGGASADARTCPVQSIRHANDWLQMNQEGAGIMGHIVYLMNLSLDGFIEGPDGSFAWGRPDEELHQFFNQQAQDFSAFLYGRRMYEVMSVWQTVDTEPSASGFMAEFARIW